MSREMKHSGVDWLGDIPSHWKLLRARFMFKQSTSKGNERLVLLSATQDRGVVDKSTLDSVVQVAENADLSLFKTVHRNDFVISLRSFQGGFEMSHEEGVISPAYTVFRLCNQDYPHYYRYLFKSYGFIDKINSLTVGIREGKNIQYVDFSNMLLPCFDIDEQQKIASFLDRKCSEIDEMVVLQEKIIEELKAYKQSVITEAVTKGLNPDVPMKDSGIEWIGEIPENWEVKRLKNVFRLKTGTTPDGYDVIGEGDKISWFTPSDISDECNELYGSERSLLKSAVGDVELFPLGSIMFVGIGASAGKLGYAQIEGYSNQQITALIPNGVNGKYFYYFLIADKRRLKDNAFFTTLPIINNGYLSQNRVICPPISVQNEVVEYLDTKCSEIDNLISIKQSKIESLKEYKKSIIYEYVIGKKEVI